MQKKTFERSCCRQKQLVKSARSKGLQPNLLLEGKVTHGACGIGDYMQKYFDSLLLRQ
jgi:hypothetical protein